MDGTGSTEHNRYTAQRHSAFFCTMGEAVWERRFRVLQGESQHDTTARKGYTAFGKGEGLSYFWLGMAVGRGGGGQGIGGNCSRRHRAVEIWWPIIWDVQVTAQTHDRRFFLRQDPAFAGVHANQPSLLRQSPSSSPCDECLERGQSWARPLTARSLAAATENQPQLHSHATQAVAGSSP